MCQVEAQLFCADRHTEDARTDGHDEANNRFRESSECAQKLNQLPSTSYFEFNFYIFSKKSIQCPSGLMRGSATARLQALRVRIPPAARLSLFRVLCVGCQVEDFATGRSLVQRNSTDCDESNWMWWTIPRFEGAKAHEGCWVIAKFLKH